MKRCTTRIAVTIAAILLSGSAASVRGGEGRAKSESFDRDPKWDQRNNRYTRKDLYLVVQDFGHSPTNHAGGQSGEIGGEICRSVTPAYYADRIEPRTLNDKLSASGSFALVPQRMQGTFHFGWFNSARQGWRPWSALGFRVLKDGKIALDYMTQTWHAGGAFPDIGVQPDGARHTWSLTYDPADNEGGGEMTFVLDDHPPVVVRLAPGHKAKGATFDRFGVYNQQSAGGPMTVYFDDLQYDGQREDFSSDPKWEQVGNRVKFREKRFRGAQDYGYSKTGFAGGKARGEMGGLIWRPDPTRDDQEGYYADTVGPLTLDKPLLASGKVALTRGATDSDLHFGWFRHDGWTKTTNTADRTGPPMIAITVGGPAQSFHYFRPTYATGREAPDQVVPGYNVADPANTPRIVPDGEPHEWTIAYDPEGNGTITVTLDGQSSSLELKQGVKEAPGMTLDRFGLFTMRPDGNSNEIYFDDLTYTVSQP